MEVWIHFFFVSMGTLVGISSFSWWWDESSWVCCPAGGGLRWTWNAQRGRAWYFARACLHPEFGYIRADLIRTVWIILLDKCNSVVQAVSSRLYTAEPRVRSKACVFVCVCVWGMSSINLKNEAAYARFGLLHHRERERERNKYYIWHDHKPVQSII